MKSLDRKHLLTWYDFLQRAVQLFPPPQYLHPQKKDTKTWPYEDQKKNQKKKKP